MMITLPLAKVACTSSPTLPGLAEDFLVNCPTATATMPSLAPAPIIGPLALPIRKASSDQLNANLAQVLTSTRIRTKPKLTCSSRIHRHKGSIQSNDEQSVTKLKITEPGQAGNSIPSIAKV